MSPKFSSILFSVFALTVVFTGYGILHIGSGGGPCNAGVEIIVLFPGLFLTCLLLIIALLPLTDSLNNISGSSVMLSLVSCLIWTYFLHYAYKEHGGNAIKYLGPFELFNVMALGFFLFKGGRITVEEK